MEKKKVPKISKWNLIQIKLHESKNHPEREREIYGWIKF